MFNRKDQTAQIHMRWFGFFGLRFAVQRKKGSKETVTSTSKQSGRVTYFIAKHYKLHYHNL